MRALFIMAPYYFVVGALTGISGDITLISLFCEFSRQIVSFAEQLGEQYSGLGFCLACCCNCGNSACFTCCELPLYFGELLLQPTASTLSSVSISLYFCQFFIGFLSFFIYGPLAALLFCSFGYFTLQCSGRISKVTLCPLQFPG
nr:MAG TPA: hypothetical protein [Caudoviricetes sp.]DAQ78522.1 MAG TPA: hypothetical protein [Caudoviricetes sp.]